MYENISFFRKISNFIEKKTIVFKKCKKTLDFHIFLLYNFECVHAMMCKVADTPG